MKQLPVVKILRLTLELAAVVLIVSLTLIAAVFVLSRFK